jgi:hypothetical protein
MGTGHIRCQLTLGYTFHGPTKSVTFFRVVGVPVVHLHPPSKIFSTQLPNYINYSAV